MLKHMMRCPECSVLYETGTERCAVDETPLVPIDEGTMGRLQTVAIPGPPSSPFLRVSSAALAVAPPAFGELPAGMVVGEFRIQEKIGHGGMAVVYLGVHPVIGKRAAIKVLNPDFAQDLGAVGRFVQEARAVNQIGHRNIVDIFQFGQLPDGRNFLVMELLEGRSLAAHIKDKGALPLFDVLTIALPICDALGAAHRAHIVHRDLKPDNVFLESPRQGGAMEVKLLDFGIAKLSSLDAASPTKSGTMIGTPHYMAPEQIRAGAVDPRTDVYALGVVLYEMLTGRTPHDAETIYSLIAHKLNTRPSSPSVFVRTPSDLEALILRCLELDPDRRPSTMAEVHAELCAIARAEGIPIATASTSVPIQLPTWVPPKRRRKRQLWLLAGLGVLSVGTTVVLALRPAGSGLAQLPPPVAEGGPAAAPLTAKAATIAPVPAQGSLEVRTNLVRAMFYLDEKLVGDGSGTLRVDEVTAGAHAIRVEAEGHRPRSAAVQVTSGKPAFAYVALERRSATAAAIKKRPPPRPNGRDLPDPFAE